MWIKSSCAHHSENYDIVDIIQPVSKRCISPCCKPNSYYQPSQVISRGHIAVEVGWKCDLCEFLNFNKIMTVAGVNMISQSCEIDHSECHYGSGRQTVSQICQARSPDKNLGATDPRAPVSHECWPNKLEWFA